MLIVGLVAGVLLATAATSFAAGSSSKISAYLRDGFTFKVHGKTASLQHTPIVYQDTTYLPVRDVAGMLGYDVGYADNTITLDQKIGDVVDVSTPTETVASDWISLKDLSSNYNIAVGVGDKVKIGTVEFDRPAASPDRVVQIETSSGSFELNIENHLFYIKAEDMKRLGVIQ